MNDWQEVLKLAGFPTDAIVLDFETYWDRDFTLTKLSTIEYVKDKRFELTGLATQRVGYKAFFLKPIKAGLFLADLRLEYGDDLAGITVICQNTKFDCLILQERFGITPKYTVDIMDLDKMWDARSRHHLADMAKRWGAPTQKGDTVQSKGYRWKDMTPPMKKAWAAYAVNDVKIEEWLFKKMMPLVVSRPEIELPVANLTLQMYLRPSFKIDLKLGRKLERDMTLEIVRPIDDLRKYGIEVGSKDISGEISFVELLRKHLPDDETVPVKAGKPTKNMIPLTGPGLIPALAKDDEGLRLLLEHKDEKIRALAIAKQSVQSWPLHIKKVISIMKQAEVNNGMIGSPLGYHNAHTARWGGAEKINLQNMAGKGRGKENHPLLQEIRHMLEPPDGHLLGIQDYSKVEAVGLAWQAGQDDLTEAFRTGADVYSELATELFQKPVHKPTGSESKEEVAELTVQRGFGKDAILGCGYGMGASKFYDRCYSNDDLRPKFDDGTFGTAFIERVVKTYRNRYKQIPAYWRKLEKAWRFVTTFKHERIELEECNLEFWHNDGATFIRLPSGRTLRYPDATVNRRTKDLRYHYGPLWGGTLTENVIQALCRDFIAESLLKLETEGFWPTLTVHDEIVCNLPIAHAEEMHKTMGEIMATVPDWATGFPLSVEGSIEERYCK